MELEVVVIVCLVSAFFGFLLITAAVALGTIIAHNHMARRAYKEQNRTERKTRKPSALRAEREARMTQGPQTPAQPPVGTPPQTPATPSQWR